MNKRCPNNHNLSKTKIYDIWMQMKMRCYNENNKGYKNYGARGIKVCPRWLEPEGKGFKNFLEDMGERPEGMSLDRKDNNGDYSKDNCQWSSRSLQCVNRRKLVGNREVSSKHKSIHKSGKGWRVTIYRDKEVVFDKFNKTEEAAVTARDCWLKENE